jgi:glutathione synthase/RimK-type ligase-like ATP-grasp enzyme
MTRIAFASFLDEMGLEQDYIYEDERLLREPLLTREVEVETIPWERPMVEWAAFDAVIIRSTWNYHLRWPAFSEWLTALETQGVRVLNPIPMLRWNIDKTYLGTLSALGIRTLPTVFIPCGSQADLSELIRQRGWSQAVVKPTISAGGDNTWRVDADTASSHQERFLSALQQHTLMVQQFAERISEGEWSFHFFNGLYSHAVRKVPASGEMFVHVHRGGSVHSVQPTSRQIGEASNIVYAVQQTLGILPLYARVDMVMHEGHLTLMELELVEPYLYMQYADRTQAHDRFADAIVLQVKR